MSGLRAVSRSAEGWFVSKSNTATAARMPKMETLSSDQLFAALAAVALFFTRPTALGELYSMPGMLLVALAGVGIIVASAAEGRRPLTGRIPQLWSYLGYAFYLGILVLAGGRSQSDIIIFKGVFVVLIGATFGFALLADRDRARIFYDVIAGIIIVLSASTLVTVTLVLIGRGVMQLRIGAITYTYQPPAGTLLFPISMLYNYTLTWFGLMPRLSGWFREVGIFPAFACWAAGYAAFRRWNIITSTICLAATVLCFSSIGALTGLICTIGIIAHRSRLPAWAYFVAGPLIALAAALVTYDLPYIGIGYKHAHDTISYVERWNAIASVTNGNLLFGSEQTNRNAGINLVSSISNIGIAGVSFLSVTLLLATQKPRYFVAALLSPFVVALVSQPIAQEPFFVLLFLSWTVFEPAPALARVPTPDARMPRVHA